MLAFRQTRRLCHPTTSTKQSRCHVLATAVVSTRAHATSQLHIRDLKRCPLGVQSAEHRVLEQSLDVRFSGCLQGVRGGNKEMQSRRRCIIQYLEDKAAETSLANRWLLGRIETTNFAEDDSSYRTSCKPSSSTSKHGTYLACSGEVS